MAASSGIKGHVMKRKGFLSKVLAFMGVGAVVSVGKPSLSESTPIPGHVMPPPLPADGTLERRLRDMIARDRFFGLEVNYFHTNRATMEALRAEFSPFSDKGPLPEYATLTVGAVRWWGCEEMVKDEILVSDTGIAKLRPKEDECPRCGDIGQVVVEVDHAKGIITLAEGTGLPVPYGALYGSKPCPLCQCPRCGGTGLIPLKGSKGDMSPWMGHRADGIIPAGPEIDAYSSVACPLCLEARAPDPVARYYMKKVVARLVV